jgi:hypothetical protein
MMKRLINHGSNLAEVYESAAQYDHESSSQSSEKISVSDSSDGWSLWSSISGDQPEETPTQFPMPPPDLISVPAMSASESLAGSFNDTIECPTEDATEDAADDAEDATVLPNIAAVHLYCDYVSKHISVEPRILSMGFSILARVGLLKMLALHDRCTCFCSPRGCTLMNMMLRTRVGGSTQYHKTKTEIVPDLLEGILRYSSVTLGESYRAIARVECFERLGMRRTCCDINGSGIASLPYRELREFQKEDAGYKVIPDKWMEAFKPNLKGSVLRRLFFGCLIAFPQENDQEAD